VSFRPTIEVAPPPEWHGEIYVAAPSVEVRAPGFFAPPVPGVSVEVRGPGFVAPPPPRVEVRGGVEMRGGMVVGPPGGGRIEHAHWEEHRERHEERHEEHREMREDEQHDNGRHEGWQKHGRH
jgi:hypothetical protein